MAEPAAPQPPPFNQQQLVRLAALKLGTLKEGKVRPTVTADKLGLGANGTQTVQRWLNGKGVIHWDDAWQIYRTLGWIRDDLVKKALVEAEKAEKQARRRLRPPKQSPPREESENE